MFTDLVSAWYEYQSKLKVVPYNGDVIQAYGMKFCSIYNNNKTALCELVDIPEDEFNYGLKAEMMSIVIGVIDGF